MSQMRLLLLLIPAALIGCTRSASTDITKMHLAADGSVPAALDGSPDSGDGGADNRLPDPPDLARLPSGPGSSTLPADFAVAVTADGSSVAPDCHAVVNEILLSITGRPDDQFVEIHNPCAQTLSLKSSSLRSRSAGNNGGAANADTILVDDLNSSMLPGTYLVWGGTQFTGTKRGTLAGRLDATGGGVALIDSQSAIVDSVAYGSAVASHNFIEGAVAPLPAASSAPGQTLARLPDGHDSDDDAHDFAVSTDPTPGAGNLP